MSDSQTQVSEKEDQHLHKSLKWQDAFALSMAVSGGLYISFGVTAAAIGGLAAMFIWALASLIGWIQNSLFAEMASIFPEKPGGVSIFAFEAWRERFAPAGALATFGYWFGWSAAISVISVTAGAIIGARWFPDAQWSLDLGFAQIGLPQLIGIAIIVAVMVPNLFGAQLAAWVSKIMGVVLLASFAAFILAPIVSPNWHIENLNWGLGEMTGSPWDNIRLVLVWLYLVGWIAYGTEMCAAFLPEYKNMTDGKKALRASGAYTFAVFLLVPFGFGGLMTQAEIAADPAAAFVTAFTRVIDSGPLIDVMIIAILCTLLMGVNASMADGSRALYGSAVDKLAPRQFEKLNKRGVPARAVWTAVIMNILLVVFISNPISILVAANFGYLFAILTALAGFLVLRADHPEFSRPFRVRRFAIPLAVILTGYTAVILVVGALSFDLSGYGGPRELFIGLGILALSLVLYAYRRRVQEKLPLLTSPRSAEELAAATSKPAPTSEPASV
ncbi:APC family permease [Arthrobacter sp. TS-15]|uniref:APC family permease n=1 Tax=Arthrobacter sp. TS-15 TaxID=2510797 RepID=UPI00115CB27E|nr:APC family permease [Arthrobacter sp. TS-15]TQS88920.1 APC family permease [Arthrobacter sp. TS-15]